MSIRRVRHWLLTRVYARIVKTRITDFLIRRNPWYALTFQNQPAQNTSQPANLER